MSDYVIRLPIEDAPGAIATIFRTKDTITESALLVHGAFEDAPLATMNDERPLADRLALTSRLIARGMEAQRWRPPTATILAATDAGHYVRDAAPATDLPPTTNDDSDEIEHTIWAHAHKCWLCNSMLDTAYLPAKEMEAIRLDNPLHVRVPGRLCENCRAEMVGYTRPSQHRPHDPDVLTAMMTADRYRHRCMLCHVGFDTPRKLSSHTASPKHRHLAKVDYLMRAGFAVVRGKIARQIRNILSLTLHPSPIGQSWEDPTMAEHDWTAVPIRIWDLIIGAMLAATYRDQICGGYLIISRKEREALPPGTVFPMYAGLRGYERSKACHNAHVALAIAVAVKEAVPEAAIEWPRLAWGQGEIEVESRFRQGTPVFRMDEQKAEQRSARALAQTIRREVTRVVGPAYMATVQEIWGIAPPGQRARTARASQE